MCDSKNCKAFSQLVRSETWEMQLSTLRNNVTKKDFRIAEINLTVPLWCRLSWGRAYRIRAVYQCLLQSLPTKYVLSSSCPTYNMLKIQPTCKKINNGQSAIDCRDIPQVRRFLWDHIEPLRQHGNHSDIDPTMPLLSRKRNERQEVELLYRFHLQSIFSKKKKKHFLPRIFICNAGKRRTIWLIKYGNVSLKEFYTVISFRFVLTFAAYFTLSSVLLPSSLLPYLIPHLG